MKPLRYIHTLFRFYITTALIVILGASCANDNTDNSHSPTAKYDYNKDTPETRAARMRKALRETSKGQEIHQKVVENVLKQTQNLLDERGLGEIITEAGRAKIESKVRDQENKEIERFASHNCYLRIDPLVASSRRSVQFIGIESELKQQERRFKEGKISAEAFAIAKEKAHLEKEDCELSSSLSDFLVSANNFG